MDEIAAFIEEQTESATLDDETKQVLVKVSACIQKHGDYKDAIGTGKTLILLKCLSECSDVLQEKVLQTKSYANEHKFDESALKEVLIEMLEPLHALHNQLINVQEQIISGVEEDSISFDMSTTESLVHTMTEINKGIQQIESEKAVFDNEEISLIMEVDREIHSIQNSIRSVENLPAAHVVMEISKPIEEIDKSLHTIMSSETVSENKGKLAADVNSYIDSLESALDRFINIEIDILASAELVHAIDINESIQIAVELKSLLTLSSEDLSSPKLVKMKNEKMICLKQMLKFDWLNTDTYLEGKNSLEIEKLKRVFLTTYQLLTEIDQVVKKLETSKLKEDREEGKHRVYQIVSKLIVLYH